MIYLSQCRWKRVLVTKSHPPTLGPCLWASKVPFPWEESSSIWSAPHYRDKETQYITVVRACPSRRYSQCWWIDETSRTNTHMALYVRCDGEEIPTSWWCNRARSRWAWQKQDARSNTWWQTLHYCDPSGPSQGLGEGKGQNRSVPKDSVMPGVSNKLY